MFVWDNFQTRDSLDSESIEFLVSDSIYCGVGKNGDGENMVVEVHDGKGSDASGFSQKNHASEL
jgi:hypothetical protein